MTTTTLPRTAENETIRTARKTIEEQRDTQIRMSRAVAYFSDRPAEIDAALDRMRHELGTSMLDRHLGVADAAEKIRAIREQITDLKAECEGLAAAADEAEKRRHRAACASSAAQKILSDLRDYDAAKDALADEKYTGSTGAMQASRRLDELAHRLGLEDDLVAFWRWLRDVKPAVYWHPRDRRGAEGGLK